MMHANFPDDKNKAEIKEIIRKKMFPDLGSVILISFNWSRVAITFPFVVIG